MLIQGEEVTCKKVRTGEFKALQVHVKDCGKNCNLVHSVLPSTLGKTQNFMWWWIATKHTLVLIHKHTVSFCEKFDNTKTFPGLERVAHDIFIIECMCVDDGIN